MGVCSSKIGAMDGSSGCLSHTAEIEREIVELYEKEADGMLRYAGALAGERETARDALQEAFFRFFLCRSAGQAIRSPKAWLFRVAHNYVLDQKKAATRHAARVELLDNLEQPPEADDHGSEMLEGLQRAGLSSREMECVRLRTEGLRYEEIAGVLGLQSGTVGALLARAHGKLRKAVGGGNRLSRDFAGTLAREKGYAS
jgi:RNA polymerase sigma-70 factor (ECF subfamily)